MSTTLQELETVETPELVTTLRNAGIAGAGGAGFPTHAKWERLEETPFLMVNHQESEPNYYIDKWLGQDNARTFASFFDALLAETFEVIVVCAKEKDRDRWLSQLEEATDGTVYEPDDLPIDPTAESGVVFTYTDDRYQYGMESVLLRIVADIAMRDELPMDHGWIVQNTETLYNIYQALDAGNPVTSKYVHVDGDVSRHRFLEVPIGTPAPRLLEAAGRPPEELDDDTVLLDGGPGWCFEIETDPSDFGVTKRTNCLLALDQEVVEENVLGGERVNVLEPVDWAGNHETRPTAIEPDRVRVPLITNDGFGDIVSRSTPIVEAGQTVETGEMIAVPASDGISNAHHAPVEGTVDSVEETHIEISGEPSGRTLDHDRMIYWTWCDICGAYVARPESEHLPAQGTAYVCRDCR